jgi:hypothetical protein
MLPPAWGRSALVVATVVGPVVAAACIRSRPAEFVAQPSAQSDIPFDSGVSVRAGRLDSTVCPTAPSMTYAQCAAALGHPPRGLNSERGWPPMFCPCGQATQVEYPWPISCYQQIVESDQPPERLWVPASRPPHGGVPGCEWPWPSIGPRPAGLLTVFIRSSLLEYGVNVYEDGRVVFKSLRCPRDLTPHTRQIPLASVATLREAFRSALLPTYNTCGTPISDSEVDLFAFYDQGEEHVVLAYWATPQAEALRKLGDTTDLLVGTGEWINLGQ